MPSELLVEVCRVVDVQPHPNADRLDIVTVKGWQCVVQKGKYTVGQHVVYFPIDSVLTDELNIQLFPPDSKITLDKCRIKTVKLRGVVSQGLVVDLETLGLRNLYVGANVKDLLGVTKHQSKEKVPNQFAGKIAKKREGSKHFTPYTSINNIKNFPYHLDGKNVVINEKIHGTNFRAGIVPYEPTTWWERLKYLFSKPKSHFVYGSHNVQLKPADSKNCYYPTNVYWNACSKYDIEGVCKRLKKALNCDSVVIYGEVYGEGIQKNYSYGCKKGEQKLVVFDIKIDGFYVDADILDVYCTCLYLPMCPELYRGEFNNNVLIDMTNSVLAPSQKVMEGYVIRSTDNNRLIFKHINPDYLLSKNNTEWT